MEEAAVVRRAARDALDDIEPLALRELLSTFIDDGSLVPGTVVLLVAGDEAGDGLAERAAGVQLIYDGLRLTRTLAHDEPWAAGEGDAGDMRILAADVLVARGFYLLARTEAATAAVEVVRAFGRDQTLRIERDDPSLDATLERDVLDLAVCAGTTARGHPLADRTALVGELADGVETGFPAPEGFFSDGVRERLVAAADSPYADL